MQLKLIAQINMSATGELNPNDNKKVQKKLISVLLVIIWVSKQVASENIDFILKMKLNKETL